MGLFKNMLNSSRFFCISIFLFPSFIFSSIFDYKYPYNSYPSFSNYGTLGVIQNPNARFMDAGSLAFSWSSSDPYLRGSIIAYPFSWFEASYQYTDINNALYSDIPEFSGGQSYKDKSFDAKFRILKEKRYLPALAIGLRDLAGTGVFSSEYIVASKKYKNVDFSMGIGWGTLSAGKITNPLNNLSDRFRERTISNSNTRGGEVNLGYLFSGPVGIFGGMEVILPNLNGARFKIEYDGIDYTKEGFPFGRDSFKFATEPVRASRSRINIGALYPVSNIFHLKMGYIKGNTLNFGFSLQASLGGKDPFVKKRDRLKEVPNSDVVKVVTEKNKDLFYKASLRYLGERDIYLQKAHVDEDTIHIQYSQSKFQSFIRSGGRLFNVLDQISPNYIKTFKVTNINAGMEMHTMSIDRESFNSYGSENLYNLTSRELSITPPENLDENYDFEPRSPLPKTFWRISPSIRSQIGGPDGFYFGDLRLSFISETLFRKNINLKTDISYGFADNFDQLKLTSDSIIPHVRTDINEYLKEGSKRPIIKRFQFNYFNRFSRELFYKVSGGLFESMFGGLGGEVLYRPFYQSYAIGAELWHAKQREYDQLFDFRDYDVLTGHLNFYYKHPSTNVLLQLKGGRFLAGDSGFNFDFSRRFKSGLRVGAFFSLTDISKEEFGEGSFDKGFYFFMPIEMFFQNYSKANTGFGLRPITRDGASYLIHGLHLYGVTEQSQYNNLIRDIDDIYE